MYTVITFRYNYLKVSYVHVWNIYANDNVLICIYNPGKFKAVIIIGILINLFETCNYKK